MKIYHNLLLTIISFLRIIYFLYVQHHIHFTCTFVTCLSNHTRKLPTIATLNTCSIKQHKNVYFTSKGRVALYYFNSRLKCTRHSLECDMYEISRCSHNYSHNQEKMHLCFANMLIDGI